MLDRTVQPPISKMEIFDIMHPEDSTMSNGVPLRILRSGESEVVRLDIMIGCGQWYQELPLQATFTCRMLREGTTRYTSQEIAEKLDYYGAWLDVSSSMNYSFITLYSLNKYFLPTLEILASMLKEPVFPEKEFAVVLDGNRQQFLVNQEKVEILSRRRLNMSLFGREHPCGRYAELHDYDQLRTSHLKEMHRRYFHSGNCTCYLSGHVTSEITAALEREVGCKHWGEHGERPQLTPKAITGDGEKHIFIEKKEALQSAIRLGCFSIDSNHPDFIKLRVLITLFGGYFGSRLMKNIREDKGYTYGIGASLVTYPFRNMLMINTQAANEYVAPIIQEVGYEMERLRNEQVSTKELEMVKNYTMGDMCRGYESPFSLADAYIYLDTFGWKKDFFLKSQQELRDITPADIQDLACKYFHKEELVEVVAGKKL